MFKSGDITCTDNYRGLILCSVIGKLFSLILTKRLKHILESNNKIHKLQGGFRDDHRTSDNVYILTRLIKHYKAEKRPLYTCFVDFRKAFDRVNRKALLYKLDCMGIGGKFYHTIKSMYSSDQFCIKLSNFVTEYFQSNIGVRQGDGMSPILFNVFINDLISELNSDECTPAKIENVRVGCLLYADDVVIMSDTETGLQTSLDKIAAFCNKWSLSVNTNKTKVIVFNKRDLDKFKFTIENELLEIVKSYKYLGIIVSQSGSMTHAISNLSMKALKCIFALKKDLSCHSFVPLKIYLKCFDSLIRPILLYNSEVWGQDLLHTRTEWKINLVEHSSEPERIHLKFCKSILHVPANTSNIAVRSELGRVPMIIPIIESILKYYARLEGMSSDRPVKQIYAVTKNDKFSLQNIALRIMHELDLDQSSFQFNDKMNRDKFYRLAKSQIQHCFEEDWFTSITLPTGKRGRGNKLRTYQIFKRKYCFENYLDCITKVNDRINLTKLRVSAHKLRIETGRHERNIIEETDRTCKVCNRNEIEDEYHFIMICPLYEHLRSSLFKELKIDVKTSRATFIKLMSAETYDFAGKFSKYISDCFHLRLSKL